MDRERCERAWPVVLVVACLSVFGLTWPPAWDDEPPFQPPPESVCSLAPMSAAATPETHLRAAGSGGPKLAPIPDLLSTPKSDRAADWPTLVPDVRRVVELEMVEPAGKLGSRPIDFDWPDFEVPDPVLPDRRSTSYENMLLLPLAAPQPDRGQYVPGRLALRASVDRLLAANDFSPDGSLWATDVLPVVEQIASQSVVTERDRKWDSTWPEPVTLLERLESLRWECETGPWAKQVAGTLQELGLAAGAGSEEQLAGIVARLEELDGTADGLAAQVEESRLATRLRRAQHALRRRLAAWSQVASAGGLWASVHDPAELDARGLSSCLERVDAVAGDPEIARAWREYLALDRLEQICGESTGVDRRQCRALARRALDQFTQLELPPERREFVDCPAYDELKLELRRWASEPLDVGDVLRHMEQYEQSGSPMDARLLAEDRLLLGCSRNSEHREFGRRLEMHYRSANVRIVFTGELLNRTLPDREPEHRRLDDRVLGRLVRGRSVNQTDLGVRMVPDAEGLRLALEVRGLISSLTTTTSGPATFYNESKSAYLASKEIELGTWGLRFYPAKIAVDNDIRLRSLKTKLDIIPVLGGVVQEIAHSQHEQSQPEMNRYVEQKVAAEAKRQIDEEVDAQLGDLNEALERRVFQPLSDLSLSPTMIDAHTSQERATMRLRLAGEDQVAGHTPRPRALANSLASCQIHESAVNNAIQRMCLDGGTFTLAEVRRRIAEVFNYPEMLEQDPGREDVKITFAAEDAICVRCQVGRMLVRVSIARLSNGSRRWKGFKVRAYYRPNIDGQNAELVRDGVVELDTRGSLGTQIVLRGIFSKAFSKNRPWKLTPESLVDDGRLADLAVTQLVIDDGWIGLALGPGRFEARAVVAQRTAEHVD